MTKEEKIAFAKMFYDKLNLKNYNLKIKRDNDINSDYIWIPDMRVPGSLMLQIMENIFFVNQYMNIVIGKKTFKKEYKVIKKGKYI